MGKIDIRQAVDAQEIQKVFEIRRQVFVEEQNIFKHTDKDENDAQALYLMALMDGEIIGVVRVFPVGDHDDEWVGGRLAVKKPFRGSSAGWRLVQAAVELVKIHGCRRFTAMIQKENVSFFEKLGWQPFGPLFLYHGKEHMAMSADLGFGAETDFAQELDAQVAQLAVG